MESKKKRLMDYIFGAHNYEANFNPKRQAKIKDLGHGKAKVLVWELPVRIWHWVNFLAIIVLMFTGLYIALAFTSARFETHATSFLMGWMRWIHFVTAFVFMAALLFRIYWTFVGNRYTTFDIYKPGFIRGLWESVKFYIFLPNKKPHTIGHNALAQFAYWIFFGICSIILSITGLYLFFEPQQGSFMMSILGWVPIIFGNSVKLHIWHQGAAWGTMIFMVAHIYLAFREDYLVTNGTMSSIFSGWKFDKKKYVVGEENE
jgi:Ni/Fe-hydrogenase 1 B-type cytochrome subunit